MKALTLTQPWATLVAIGAKQYETRSWRTNYRGPLAIHAAKGFPPEAHKFANYDPYVAAAVLLRQLPFVPVFPLGVVLCVVTLTGCVRTEDLWNIEEQEQAFGDYSPGRYAWQLSDRQVLAAPYLCKGSLGLWDITIPVDYKGA